MGSHFRPGALCSGEGCVDRRRGQKFDKENSTALCTGIYTCTSERYRESKLAFLLTKEVVPLLTYWESKESYFLSEEPQLTVREETEKIRKVKKHRKRKSLQKYRTHRIRCRRRQKQNPWRRQKNGHSKAVKKKKRKKNKKAQTEETKEQQETVNMEELQDFQTLVGNYYTVDASTTADPEQINAEKLAGQDLRIKKMHLCRRF